MSEKSDSMTVVMCEPGRMAEIRQIGTSLHDLQQTVGGTVEAFYPFAEEVCIVCNEEGKFNGMDPCRAVYDESGQVVDIVFGPFFICDCSDETFASLSTAQQETYLQMFRNPEFYIRVNGKIKAVPYVPEN